MEKINLLDVNGTSIEVDVVRYFKNNDNAYLIYAMNELDDQEYLKLYAVKVMDGAILAITDENEWNSVKDVIKVIIKGNKAGNNPVEDLPYTTLEGAKVNESKVFKLSKQLADLLGADKKEAKVEVQTETEVETNTTDESVWDAPAVVAPALEPAAENAWEMPTETTEETQVEETPSEPTAENAWEMPTETTEETQVEETPSEPVSENAWTIPTEETTENAWSAPVEETEEATDGSDYKAMYEELLSKNETLEEELKELQSRIEAIKSLL